jgi:hypothetical protein
VTLWNVIFASSVESVSALCLVLALYEEVQSACKADVFIVSDVLMLNDDSVTQSNGC